MTKLIVIIINIIISFYVLFFTTATVAGLTCPSGEVENDCPSNCGTSCPKSAGEDQACVPQQQCPPPACGCPFNSRRNATGQCIPTQQCPPFPCPPNMTFVSCPSPCPTDDCSQATPDGSCPLPGFLLFVVACSPECRCIPGYWKHNGVCVPYSQCPQT